MDRHFIQAVNLYSDSVYSKDSYDTFFFSSEFQITASL